MLYYILSQNRQSSLRLNSTDNDVADLQENLDSSTDELAASSSELSTELSKLKFSVQNLLIEANGGGVMAFSGSAAAENVSAAALNAAAAGTFTRSFTVLLNFKGASFTPVLTPGETVADADVAAPTIYDSPKFSDSQLTVTLIFDTDAGATKTYVLGETLTCLIQVASDDKLLGWTVAPLTKTYNVTA